MDRTDDTSAAARRDDASFYGDTSSTASAAAPALTMDCALPGAFLRAMLATACQDETRFHLNAIYFHGIHAITTDGHTLTRASVLPTEGRERRQYLIRAENLQTAVKVAGARGIVEIWTNGKRGDECKGEIRCYSPLPAKSANVRGPLASVIAWSSMMATFPPYEQVIPAFDANPALVDHLGKATESCEPAHFSGHGVNPRYLARIADVMEGIEGRDSVTPLVFRGCRGPLDPIVYTAHVRIPYGLAVVCDRRMITFVIMPMRVTASDYGDPDVKDPSPPKASKARKSK